MGELQWTGLGCDVCGFGTVENVDEFDPRKPCPDCGNVAAPAEPDVIGHTADGTEVT